MTEQEQTPLEKIRDEIAFQDFNRKMDELMLEDHTETNFGPVKKTEPMREDRYDYIAGIFRDFIDHETKLTAQELVKKYCQPRGR